MFILPFVAIASLVAIGYVANQSKANDTQVRGVDPRQAKIDRVRRFAQRRPHIYNVLVCLNRGEEPHEADIEGAIEEAYEAGDWGLMKKLQERFPLREEEETKSEEAPEETPDVIGKTSIASPFDGVPDQAWSEFVGKLATQTEDYKGPRHIGKFHHSLSRLEQLGIKAEELTTGDKQYEALVTDLKSSKELAGEVVHEHLAHPITVSGQEHVITLSGIMGLLKAAGPQKAKSWITNAEDRERFPHTTKMFLETNGVF